ncbi:methylenetetrahydrofolate reductase [NAD(P)H] [Sphingomicrobium lutaoense]|uniref:Methylenetetrahydrofolate reductase n=1 Tax=Sphingomicrobium lutaoense TaxID=515949 RepID=A0A839Z0V0_9SPHN|nr:methylenetetrahydrofolate reductase [NAD(P)H] [Sphingomicrobium lutaoense]MBB3764310.1 methylenetetrahydrofolate reductase (NADPH) [Sphingomicrobium lutaoense]
MNLTSTPAPAPLFERCHGDIDVSFEFFPPRSEAMQERLWQSIGRLAPLEPRFVSVTYGAGGSTRERTHSTVKRILEETDLTPAAHLTCVDASREEVQEVARDYWDAGVRHIVALRGDPPDGQPFSAHPDGYANAAELVAGLKEVADFDISVAAYPEGHPEARSADADLDHLLRKIDAGAERAITQFFFSADAFFRLRDALAARGRNIELVPGVLPVTNVERTREFARKCGSAIPDWLDQKFEGLDALPDARRLVAATVATEMCGRLYAGGVRHFHFYTLNRASLSWTICHMLGVKG